MRRLIAAALLGAALAVAGCGGIVAPDLFLVERSGPGSSRLTLLVNEEGGVRCNGGTMQKLADAQIVQARAIQEELHDAANSHLTLPARPGSVLGYRVRDVDGSVSFADNSAHQPHVLRELALFVLQSAQRICHLPE